MHTLWVQFHPAACFFLTLSASPHSALFSFPILTPVSACHLPPFFFLFFIFFSYFFVLSFSFSREGWDLSKQIGGSYIPCCSTGPELLLLLFVVFYLRCTLWSISSGTLEWQGYLAGILRVIFFYSSPRASFEDGWGGRGMTVKWRSNFGREN